MKSVNKNKVELLIQLAIDGNLSLEKLYNEYPDNLKLEPFWSDIWADLEEAVEHFPFKLFSGKKDYETWKNSREFKKLKIDLALIRLSLVDIKISKLRAKIIRLTESLHSEEVDKKINLILDELK